MAALLALHRLLGLIVISASKNHYGKCRQLATALNLILGAVVGFHPGSPRTHKPSAAIAGGFYVSNVPSNDQVCVENYFGTDQTQGASV